jgi:hypothetical protein
MIFPSLGKNQYIIKENQDKLLQMRLEDIIHQAIERRWGISQPKRHDRKLIVPKPSPKSHLGNITIFDLNLVIPRPQIYLRKHRRTLDPINQVFHSRDLVLILHRSLIKTSIVNA